MLATLLTLVLVGQTCGPLQWGKDANGNKVYFRECGGKLIVVNMPDSGKPVLPEVLRVPPAPLVTPLPENKKYFFGVEKQKLSSVDRYRIGDRDVSKAAFEAEYDVTTADVMPDDALKPHLTLFARDDATRKELERLVADDKMAAVRDRYRVQVYDRSAKVDRQMTVGFDFDDDKRFQESGRAAIVQYASDTGASKATGVAFDFKNADDLVEAVPKIDPKFRFPKVPDADDAKFGSATTFIVVIVFALVLVATIVACLFIPSPKPKE